MQRQRLLYVAAIDELIYLAVRIARDVTQNGMPRRRFIQPMNRHDRKQLFDGPAIGHALEQRKIAEVGVGEQPFQPFQLFWKIIQLLREFENFAANRPIEVLGKTSLRQGEVTQIEKVQSGVEGLLGVVIGLE